MVFNCLSKHYRKKTLIFKVCFQLVSFIPTQKRGWWCWSRNRNKFCLFLSFPWKTFSVCSGGKKGCFAYWIKTAFIFSIRAIFNGLNSLKTSWQLLTIVGRLVLLLCYYFDKFYSVWRVTHLFAVLDSLSGVCHFHFAFKLKINFIKTKIEWKSDK